MNINHNAKCYVLILFNPSDCRAHVGALGDITWQKGWVYYVGRATNGWTSRIKRLTTNEFKTHWHIDYLIKTQKHALQGIFPVSIAPNKECSLSNTLGTVRETRSFPSSGNFGNSDCGAECETHAWYSNSGPSQIIPELSKKMELTPKWIKLTARKCSQVESN